MGKLIYQDISYYSLYDCQVAISKSAFKIANLLLNPSGGDIVFVTRDANNLQRELYAYKSILIQNSEYFATSTLKKSKYAYI